MLDKNQTLIFIRKAKSGDELAKEILLKNNAPLLKSIIKRYLNKGVDYDDLYQLACVGLLKAIKNFDESYNVRFSTYAVPMIAGEIKRFMRDDGSIKVSRALKILANKINKYVQDYSNKNNHPPEICEIAKKFGVESDEVVVALDSVRAPISLYDTGTDPDGKIQLIDRLPSRDCQDEIIDSLVLKSFINDLSERDKKIVMLRFYRDMTQTEISKVLGISQVQVSRLESKIIEKLKTKF